MLRENVNLACGTRQKRESNISVCDIHKMILYPTRLVIPPVLSCAFLESVGVRNWGRSPEAVLNPTHLAEVWRKAPLSLGKTTPNIALHQTSISKRLSGSFKLKLDLSLSKVSNLFSLHLAIWTRGPSPARGSRLSSRPPHVLPLICQPESQSKPIGTEIFHPEPCKEFSWRLHPFLVAILPC